jgi:arsenite/tail-anchored protein-transporting ATPase
VRDGPTRLVLYVGKGGVGKTTCAAASAVRAAELGHRTLVVSTDIAHSLGDVLGVAVGAAATEIAPNLHAQEINVLEEARSTWGKLEDQLSDLLRREGLSTVQAEELAIVPGMDEIAALVQIGRHARRAEYDCIVVDAAPTGETIRLLSMPESFRWYAGRIQEWRGRLMKLAGPFLRGALPDLNIVDAIDRLSLRVKELRGILTDTARSSYRIVVTPDRAVLREAQRAETYLNLFEYPIDAVIVNRRAPAGAEGLLGKIGRKQELIEQEIEHSFPTLPILRAPLLADEPIGLELLREFAAELFDDRDPTTVLHVGRTQEIVPSDDGYVLRLPMANLEIDKLSVTKHGDELTIDVGNFRRSVPLPAMLASMEPRLARLRAGSLEVTFTGAPTEATTA